METEYNASQEIEKQVIRSEHNKLKRLWKRVFYYTIFPFKWLWTNIRDWKTFVVFAIVFIVVSSEVWCPYLIGIICWENETLRNTMFGVGSACWLFRLGPGTPFMVIVIGITIGVKMIFNKAKEKRG